MQAGRRAEMSVSPNDLAAQPRASSLPNPMGNSSSKGFNFRRPFARRKKPDHDPDSPPPDCHHSPRPPPPQPPPKPSANALLHAPPAPPSFNRSSIIPVTAAIESAVSYMASNEDPPRPLREPPPSHSQRPEGVVLEISDKRKSDSTISHSTIRPGANGARSSRPVSMAESFQSTHTIVPGNGTSSLGGATKRLSAVDVDLGALREDDDSSSRGADQPGPSTTLMVVPARGDSLPANSAKKLKRRSMSLNIPPVTPLDHVTPTASATDLKHPSYSICEGFLNQSSPMTTSPSPPPTSSWIGATPLPDVNRRLPQIPTHNVSAFTYPTRRPLNNHPPAPPSFRQTAVSITSSFAPAAGLAKRAVERVRGALGHMGSSTSHGGFESSASISSGCSSSVSTGSAAPSAFPSEWGVLNLSRTPSNHSSATHGGSMHAVNIDEIKKKSEREKRKDKRRMRRTPDTQSGSQSLASISMGGSDRDGYGVSGPFLGACLRVPVKRVGSVFRRELASCVRETAVWVGNDRSLVEEMSGRGPLGRPELRIYEKRMLPAIVVRCAQHLLIWGVQEEGLFRVPGRAAHVTRLRTEFDSGADYDMSSCTPGDLDPHAVASVFKAYLRELPEHILTQKLSQYFDAAIEQESSTTSHEPPPSPASPIGLGMRRGIGLPSSQKPLPSTLSPSSTISSFSSSSAAYSAHNLRKPPSLSTLAMPSFNGMKPASHSLISALRLLIAKLPVENRDLLRTVVELIRATAREFKLTKMPLGNLLVPFLPTLSVSAQLLRILCEEESVWDGLIDNEDVLDVKRETIVLDIKREDSGGEEEGEEDYSEDDDEEDLDSHRRRTVVNRPEIPTVYLDSRSEASSASVASSALVSLSRDPSTAESSVMHDDTSSFDRDSEMKMGEDEEWGGEEVLTSSVESSILTPLTSSGQSSMNDLRMDALDTVKDLSGKEAVVDGEKTRIRVLDSEAPGAESYVVPRSLVVAEPRRLAVSNPLPYVSSPSSPNNLVAEKLLPQVPLSPRKRSRPTLSFPGLSAFSQRASPSNEPGEPASPVELLNRGGRNGSKVSASHMHKPSLKMLFAKRSSGSLNHRSCHSNSSRELVMGNLTMERSSSSLSAPISRAQQPVFTVQQQQHLRLMVSMPSVNRYEGSGSSDSSVSTPISAVTAPGGWDGSGSSSGRGSGVEMQLPVLDTTIKEGPSLRMELGLDVSPPGTAGLEGGLEKMMEVGGGGGGVKGKERVERVKTMVGRTPIADRFGSASVLDLRTPLQDWANSDGGRGDDSCSSDEDEDGEAGDDGVKARRRTSFGRGRSASVLSQTSSINHLGLLDDDSRDEDWTRSVLLDLDIGVRH